MQTGSGEFRSAVGDGDKGRLEMDTADAVRETLIESMNELRDLAQQCYLLIGLTRDARLKSHLLDLGLEIEQRIGLIERRARTE